MHLLLLIILHAFSELVHDMDFVLGLLPQHQRQQSPLLLLEQLGLVSPFFINRYDLASIHKISKDADE